MVPKISFPTHFTFYSFLTIFILFFYSFYANGQCAGIDNVLPDVCDIANISSQTIDLSTGLGVHTLGGTWKDDDKSGGLNKTTGILNAQLIKKSGTYTYTYTVTGASGCSDNTAVVTVTIGGYTGVPAPNVSICNANEAYNLFEAFNGSFLAPQAGGTWVGDTSSLGLSDNVLNARELIPGNTYEYTYSIPAIGSCVAPPNAKIYVTIYRAPQPGIPSDLRLCSNNLSTNYDLNEQLIGEDLDGFWSEATTDEIDNNDDTDSFIDVQNIYNTKGPGTYPFTYSVISNNNVCADDSSIVDVIIEKLLDYTGATLTVTTAVCENEVGSTAFSATIKDVVAIPDGSYTITYGISGNGSPFTTTQNFVNNVLTFPLASSNFAIPGNYTVTVTNIVSSTTLGICTNIIPLISGVIQINPIPVINAATLTIDPICQNSNATVVISGNSNLSDGDYDILYNLTGTNTATAIPARITVVGKVSSFSIPTSLLPNSGNSTITITKITNVLTGCTNSSTLNKVFTVIPLPDMSTLLVAINDVCQGQPATVTLTGLGSMTDIAITYTITGANSLASQTIPLTVTAGAVNISILETAIPNVGLTSFTITALTNNVTGCTILSNLKTDFTVNSLPNIPVATDLQQFCSSINATVANLSPQGVQYQWFDSATSTVPLISTTVLVTDDYYVKEVNTITGCESPLKAINVNINATPQINSAVVTIDPICQGSNALVSFAIGSTNLTDGNYDILYNLSGTNVATAVSTVLNVANGIPVFSINANLIPNAGSTTVAITNITNQSTNCSNTTTLSKNFVVNAIPDISTMIVTVKDICLGQNLVVDLTGLVNLTNITLSYAVSGANPIASQTIPLVVNMGKTSFTILGSALSATGSNTLVITDLTNATNSCSAVFSPVSRNFSINAIPNNPTATSIQKFCETDLETVASLVPNGNQYKWYDSLSSSTSLASDKLLVTGNYYVKESNATTGCESGPTEVSVVINTVLSPTLKPNGQEFCGIDKPTILNLSNNTNTNGNLTWYDAPSNGTLFTNTDLLTEGTTYYGFDLDTNTNCYSNPLLATVTLTNCTATPENFLIPDGFSPNGDGVNETFQIVDIEFIYPNYTLEIFNRYGNVLFEGNINKPTWDGKNSNSSFIDGDAPTGVYFYVINYNKDNLPPKQGQLYLNR
jgi:gliding motility-associated-like protein